MQPDEEVKPSADGQAQEPASGDPNQNQQPAEKISLPDFKALSQQYTQRPADVQMTNKHKEMLKEKMKAESYLSEVNDKMMAYISVHTLEETVINIMSPLMDKVNGETKKMRELTKRVDDFY